MSRFLWQAADELVADEERDEDLAERFNPHQPRDDHGRWTDGGGSTSTGSIGGGGGGGRDGASGAGGGARPGTGTRTVSTSSGQVSVSRRADGSGSIDTGGTSRSLSSQEFTELSQGIGSLEFTPTNPRTDLKVGGQQAITGPDGNTLAVAKRTGSDTFTLHLSPRPGASEQETADAPGIAITARDAGRISDSMEQFGRDEAAAARAEREAIRQERIRTGAINQADAARRASSRPPAARDPAQRGMPETVASEEITPAGGGPAVGVHTMPGDESIHVSQGGRSVALTIDELHSLNVAMDEADDLGVGDSVTVRDDEGFAFGTVTKTGRNTFDVAIDGQPALTGVRDTEMDKIARAGDRLNGSGRVDTDYGPLDVFASGRKVGLRHMGDDGRPVEVQFTRSNAARLATAMGDLEDEDLAPGQSVSRDVKTTAGPVRVELRGPWGQRGSRLYVSPAEGDAWGAIIDGPHMDDFRSRLTSFTEAARPLGEQVWLTEAAAAAGMKGRRFRARLIAGDVQGSSGYYPADMLRRHADVFPAGLPVFLDHPTVSEGHERPERSVRDLAGRLATDAVYERDGLYADVEVYPHWAPVIEAMWPDIGMSIRASGTVEPSPHQNIPGPIVTALTDAESVDFVTAAGAGGKIVALLESARARSGHLGRAAEALVVEAKVSDKPWSGFSQADYSIEQWRRACLIGPSEPSDSKADYKLPVREPDGTLNRNAVHAAAARIGQVDAPASVVKAAARKLVALYGQMEEDPPVALAKLAGQEREEAAPPFVKKAKKGEDDTDGDDMPDFLKKKIKGAKSDAKESALREGRNVGGWFEARVHRAFTELADTLYGEGHLTRPERIALSSAIGEALGAFAAHIQAEQPHLFERDLYDDPTDAQGIPPTRHPKEGSMPELTEAQAKALAEAAAVRTELDDTRAQLTEAITRLNEATEHIAGLKKRLDDADEANLRLARDRDARAIMAEALTASALPARTHARVTEAACRDLPARPDGTLDTDAFRTLAETAIREEQTYLASALEEAGYGAVRGLGESSRDAGPLSEADYTASLVESFQRLGLSADAAAIAAAGRK